MKLFSIIRLHGPLGSRAPYEEDFIVADSQDEAVEMVKHLPNYMIMSGDALDITEISEEDRLKRINPSDKYFNIFQDQSCVQDFIEYKELNP